MLRQFIGLLYQLWMINDDGDDDYDYGAVSGMND
jgi:hypothetical protein